MSIIIKGMDMPTTPKTIVIYPNGTIIDGDKKGTKILKAQAIEIPTPHGRLVDVNYLKAEMRFYESKYCGEQGYITEDDIDDAPTILEAEE